MRAARRNRLGRLRTQGGDRDELRPEHHRADDEDHRVGRHGDRREQRGQTHEGQVREGQGGLVIGPLDDLRPDDDVGRLAGGGPLGLQPTVGDPGGDGQDLDGAFARDAQIDEAVDDRVDVLAWHVDLDDVAMGGHRSIP